MPATVTLATTTLALPLDAESRDVKLASVSGILPGTRLFVDGELLRVVRLGVSPWVEVTRGDAGTGGKPHGSGLTVYIGEAHQFYAKDPVGRPPEAVPVSPWINLRNGKVWFAQGDVLPIGEGERWWKEQATTHDVGALGVRTTTYEPTSST